MDHSYSKLVIIVEKVEGVGHVPYSSLRFPVDNSFGVYASSTSNFCVLAGASLYILIRCSCEKFPKIPS